MKKPQTFREIHEVIQKNLDLYHEKLKKEMLEHRKSIAISSEENIDEEMIKFSSQKEEEIIKKREKSQKEIHDAFLQILSTNESANFNILPVSKKDDVVYKFKFPYHYTLKQIENITNIANTASQTADFLMNATTTLDSIGLLDKISLNNQTFEGLKTFDYENAFFTDYPTTALCLPTVLHILALWVNEYSERVSKKKSLM